MIALNIQQKLAACGKLDLTSFGVCYHRLWHSDQGYQLYLSNLLTLGLASFLFLGLGLLCGTSGAAVGWTPSTAVTVALICYGVGLVLALIAFMRSRLGQSLDGTTKFLARAPLGER